MSGIEVAEAVLLLQKEKGSVTFVYQSPSILSIYGDDDLFNGLAGLNNYKESFDLLANLEGKESASFELIQLLSDAENRLKQVTNHFSRISPGKDQRLAKYSEEVKQVFEGTWSPDTSSYRKKDEE